MRLYKVRCEDGRTFIAAGEYTLAAETAVTSHTGRKNVVACEPLVSYRTIQGVRYEIPLTVFEVHPTTRKSCSECGRTMIVKTKLVCPLRHKQLVAN